MMKRRTSSASPQTIGCERVKKKLRPILRRLNGAVRKVVYKFLSVCTLTDFHRHLRNPYIYKLPRNRFIDLFR